MRKLTVHDILDSRAYERERDEMRRMIIELKRRRRVALGPIMSLVFENTETMRWQVQEMARAERMLRDEQIAHEVETYNQLIPEAGELSATLLLELTSEPALREWLPRLVGIDRSVVLDLADGSRVPGSPSAEDEARLTREETTAAVHFVKFRLTPEQVEVFRKGPVYVVVDHPEYPQRVELTAEQHAALSEDLRERLTDAVQVRITRLDPDVKLPERQHPGDAGYDLNARTDARLEPAGGRALVPTGIAIAIPEGYAGFLLPRSGIALRHGVTCLNTPGLIDAGYRDEISVLLVNLDPVEPFVVHRGDRVAQLVIERVQDVVWHEVESLDDTARGLGGWGSTGRR